MTSKLPYDTQHGMVINRSKFDVSTSSSFGEVKTYIHKYICTVRTDRIALFILDSIALPGF